LFRLLTTLKSCSNRAATLLRESYVASKGGTVTPKGTVGGCEKLYGKNRYRGTGRCGGCSLNWQEIRGSTNARLRPLFYRLSQLSPDSGGQTLRAKRKPCIRKSEMNLGTFEADCHPKS